MVEHEFQTTTITCPRLDDSKVTHAGWINSFYLVPIRCHAEIVRDARHQEGKRSSLRSAILCCGSLEIAHSSVNGTIQGLWTGSKAGELGMDEFDYLRMIER